MAEVVPGISNYEIAHTTLYKVHQRVAKTFRLGRAFLAGDAAHINNPLGGMGMNGGIHDAINLTRRLAEVWHGRAGRRELDRYDKQRRLVTQETIQTQTIQNKKNLESPGADFSESLKHIAADRGRTADVPAAGVDDRQPAAGRAVGLGDKKGPATVRGLLRSAGIVN